MLPPAERQAFLGGLPPATQEMRDRPYYGTGRPRNGTGSRELTGQPLETRHQRISWRRVPPYSDLQRVSRNESRYGVSVTFVPVQSAPGVAK